MEKVLPAIRKKGGYQIKENQPIKTDLSTQTLKASKLFPPLFRVAKLINYDKNAAAISANQIVRKITDINLLEEFGHTNLEAQNQDTLFFTPTDLGQRIHISRREFNRLLVEKGFQIKQDNQWKILAPGKPYARIYDIGKRRGSGVPV